MLDMKSSRLRGFRAREIHFWKFQPPATAGSGQDDVDDADDGLVRLEGEQMDNLSKAPQQEDIKLHKWPKNQISSTNIQLSTAYDIYHGGPPGTHVIWVGAWLPDA